MPDILSSAIEFGSDDFVDASFKGVTPFDILVESLTDQFKEYQELGKIIVDHTNYLDIMQEAVDLSNQVNTTTIEEFQVADDNIPQAMDLFRDVIFQLFEQIDVDLSQVHDPDKLAYLLYTNFMLSDQTLPFFSYIVQTEIRSNSLESELAIAEGEMMDGHPRKMYEYLILQDWFDHPTRYILNFLRDTGHIEIMDWVQSGELPEMVLYQFLRSHRFDQMFFDYCVQRINTKKE